MSAEITEQEEAYKNNRGVVRRPLHAHALSALCPPLCPPLPGICPLYACSVSVLCRPTSALSPLYVNCHARARRRDCLLYVRSMSAICPLYVRSMFAHVCSMSALRRREVATTSRKGCECARSAAGLGALVGCTPRACHGQY